MPYYLIELKLETKFPHLRGRFKGCVTRLLFKYAIKCYYFYRQMTSSVKDTGWFCTIRKQSGLKDLAGAEQFTRGLQGKNNVSKKKQF